MSRVELDIAKIFSSGIDNHNGVYKPLDYFQREYEWEREHLETLTSDIEDAMNSDKDSYYIGDLILARDPDGSQALVIVDGLQRLITLSLMLSSFRDYYKLSKDNKEDVKNIEKCLYTKSKECRLQLIGESNTIYKHLINGDKVNNDNISMIEKKFINAKRFTDSWVKELDQDGEANVYGHLEYLLSSVSAGKVIEESADRAVSRFIALNARGKQLTVEALVKNCFLCAVDESDRTQCNDYRENVSKMWMETFRQLEEKRGKGQVKYIIDPIAFLRYYLLSLGIESNKSDVYRRFKKIAQENKREYTKLLDVVTDVEEAAQRYRELTKGAPNNSHVANIRTMTNSQYKSCYPTLLASSVFDSTQQREIAALLENMTFMGIILGNRYDTNKILLDVNKTIGTARSHDKRTERIEIADNIKKVLSRSMEEMRVAFLEALRNTRFGNTPTSAAKTKYILKRMAFALDGHSYDADWTIEHIMPQNSEHANDLDYKRVMSSLGNFTLVHKSDNSALSDMDYKEKCEIYKECSCRLTSSIAKPLVTGTKKSEFDKAIDKFGYKKTDVWDKAEIDARTDAMIRLIDYLFFNK